MPTTLVQDQARYAQVMGLQPANRPVGQGPGAIVYAGARWPDLTSGPGKVTKEDVDYALGEARNLLARGMISAKAALRGDEAAAAIMTTWFGPRPGHTQDWWQGVGQILAVLESNLLQNINVYYRNQETLGQPNDYPGETGNITKRDVSGYAETRAGANDLVVGLCRVFFAKQAINNARTINRTGFDSVGGVLVHELSHNLCKTEDHQLNNGDTANGTVDCQALRTQAPERAWYNADNIEYFCEEVTYGVTPPKPPVTTGGTSVKDLTTTHEAAIKAAGP